MPSNLLPTAPATGHRPAPAYAPFAHVGERARGQAIIDAVKTLRNLEGSGRPADEGERAVLSRFGGFGAVARRIFPDPITGRYHSDSWAMLGGELRGLLTDVEYDSAKRTVFTAFYTSPIVMSAMYRALERLGVPAGAKILEPGCGAGHFISAAPPDRSYRFTGVELDSLSGRIAKALHGNLHDIWIQDFRETRLTDGSFDAAVGNPPFADIKSDYRGVRLSLHDYFIAKSLDALKPGGILALVTTHSTLDKRDRSARERMADRADFVGAIRLPSDAFKREGTEVVTDILFLRRRPEGQPAAHASEHWLDSWSMEIDGTAAPVNAYFHGRPDMVLGDWSRLDTLYGGDDSYSLKSTGDIEEGLGRAVEGLAGRFEGDHPESQPAAQQVETIDPAEPASVPPTPGNPWAAIDTPPIPAPPVSLPTDAPEGSFQIGSDNVIRQVTLGRLEPVTYSGVLLRSDGTMVGRRIAALINLRDLARAVLAAQNQDKPERIKQAARDDLNAAYDEFTGRYGCINKTTLSETADGATRRMPNLVKFREDPDAMLVMALEEYDEQADSAGRAAIMRQDVVGPRPEVTSVATAQEGLLVSLDRRGRVDLPYIASLYGKDERAVVGELGDLIFHDPSEAAWHTADVYLSGNVREKLRAAREAARESEAYARNVSALEAVQPEDVLPGDIDANLGAPWIPTSDIIDFAAYLFQCPRHVFGLAHLKRDASWAFDPGWSTPGLVSATQDYGTQRANGTWLFELALNMKTPTIYDVTVEADGSETRTVNQDETLAAREKQKLIKAKFAGWIFGEQERSERLVRIYNDTYNNLRPRLFDGSHLEFPGMSKAVTLAAHQVNGVWRAMSGGNVLMAHQVGGGKAQPLDANILTPTGWKMMGELSIGDEVIAGDGSVTYVTGIFPQGVKPIFDVGFSDGSSTQCCEEHLWLTKTYRERTASIQEAKLKKDWPCAKAKIRTTKEISETLISEHLGAKNHSIPMVGVVQFDSQVVDIDPYTLGVLLGNGCFRGNTVTLTHPDIDIIDGLVCPDNVQMVERTYDSIRCPTWSFKMIDQHGYGESRLQNPMKTALLQMDLMDRMSDTKFVPDCYKFNNACVRLSVIQGLMDTDGYADKNGHSCYYYTTSFQLADDMTFLVNSLGGIVHRTIKRAPRFTYKGEDKIGKPCVVLTVCMPPNICPFRAKRKAEILKPKTKYPPIRYVTSVEPAGRAETQCISVAHPSQLYVTDDFIVTHNTFLAAAAIMKMKQSGIIRKALVGVPNHLLEQFAREFVHLYPDAKLLVTQKEDLARDRRKFLTAKIANGEWDAIIVTHSGFERIGMSREFQAEFLRDQIKEYEQLLIDAKKGDDRYGKANRNIIKQIEKAKAKREDRLKNLMAADKKDDGLVFDELGIDYLCIDESNYGKNLETPTKMERVAGIPSGGSERAFDLYMKCRYLDGLNPGHGVMFLSGTPISNTMVEMYTVQRFLDTRGLREREIEHFDAWAATFGEVVESMEISPDGASLKPRSRFAKFINLPELVQLFRSFADVQTADMLDLPRPAILGGKPAIIAREMSDHQREEQNDLVRRYDRIRNTKVDPREDNALAITTDGRKLATDGRMCNKVRPETIVADDPDSKVNAMVDRVHSIWAATADRLGTQLIFSDIGVHPKPHSVYDDVMGKLAAQGIPANQLAVMGDADTDAKKRVLFEKVRAGRVRILIGSTQKMGMGTNVQKRLVALHHLDAPWKPAEVEQREGRILRQGNDNPVVEIYRYVTAGTFDAFMWQALETKARFINQVMGGRVPFRRAEDIGGQELSYAEVKAIASGNPAILTLAESDAELQRLAILRKNHADEQFVARRAIRDLPEKIAGHDDRIALLSADLVTLETNRGEPFEINGVECGPGEVKAALGRYLVTVPGRVNRAERHPIGVYRGLAVGLVVHPSGGRLDAYMEGKARQSRMMNTDTPGPVALLNAIERLADSYETDIARNKYERDAARRKLADYSERVGGLFAHEEYMTTLGGLRDRLRQALSSNDKGDEAVRLEANRKTQDIAREIETLRAAHEGESQVEAVGAAQRVVNVTGEEPITARIRRMREEAWRAEVESPEPPVIPATPPAPSHRNRPGAGIVHPPGRPNVPVGCRAGSRANSRQLTLF